MALTPFLTQMLGILSDLCCFPPDYDPTDVEGVEDFKSFRYNFMDAIQDIACILGAQITLSCVVEIVKVKYEAYKSSAITSAQFEGALYLFRSCARIFEDENCKDDVIGQILNLATVLPPHESRLKYTMSLCVGRYSFWFRYHKDAMVQLIDFIVSGLLVPETQGASSLALKHVCQFCGDIISEQPHYLQALFDLYPKFMTLQQQEQIEYLEGMAEVISHITGYNEQVACCQKLLNPQAAVLNTNMMGYSSLIERGNVLADEKIRFTLPVVRCLERIAVFIPHAEFVLEPNAEQHPLVSAIVALWPLIEKIFFIYREEEAVLEKLTKVFKNLLRICGGFFVPLLAPLLKIIFDSFVVHPHSCFLYTTGLCVEITGYEKSLWPMFKHYLVEYSKLVLPKLNSLQGFVAEPEVAEDYFFMVLEYLLQCPLVLIDSQLAAPIFESILHGMLVEHKEAFSRIAGALRLFVWNAYSPESFGIVELLLDAERKAKVLQAKTPISVDFFKSLVQNYGQHIVKYVLSLFVVVYSNIVAAIAGAVPIAKYELLHSTFEGLLIVDRDSTNTWLIQALSNPQYFYLFFKSAIQASCS